MSSGRSIQEIKDQVRQEWERCCRYNGALIQPEQFKPEIRGYGDLRRKQTWINAYCRLRAYNIHTACTESYLLITSYFNFQESDWDYEFRCQIFDEFLAIDGMLEAIRHGLEQLFGDDTFAEERSEVDGFAELVERSKAAGRSAVVADWRIETRSLQAAS